MKKLLFAMAIGAGLAYVLDPDNGGRRRAALQRKFDQRSGAASPVRPVAAVPTDPNGTRVSSVL